MKTVPASSCTQEQLYRGGGEDEIAGPVQALTRVNREIDAGKKADPMIHELPDLDQNGSHDQFRTRLFRVDRSGQRHMLIKDGPQQRTDRNLANPLEKRSWFSSRSSVNARHALSRVKSL
jgi:hypothetical protein